MDLILFLKICSCALQWHNAFFKKERIVICLVQKFCLWTAHTTNFTVQKPLSKYNFIFKRQLQLSIITNVAFSNKKGKLLSNKYNFIILKQLQLIIIKMLYLTLPSSWKLVYIHMQTWIWTCLVQLLF